MSERSATMRGASSDAARCDAEHVDSHHMDAGEPDAWGGSSVSVRAAFSSLKRERSPSPSDRPCGRATPPSLDAAATAIGAAKGRGDVDIDGQSSARSGGRGGASRGGRGRGVRDADDGTVSMAEVHKMFRLQVGAKVTYHGMRGVVRRINNMRETCVMNPRPFAAARLPWVHAWSRVSSRLRGALEARAHAVIACHHAKA